jgi:ribonuclease P protein component
MADSNPRKGCLQPLTQRSDFAALLQTAPRLRSAHFAVHHRLPTVAVCEVLVPAAVIDSLSTGLPKTCAQPVDNKSILRLGVAIPKRHAKRAVTRNLIKRQLRAGFASAAQTMPAGDWLIRLTRAFSPETFVSASSPALRAAVRDEVAVLLMRAGKAMHLKAPAAHSGARPLAERRPESRSSKTVSPSTKSP